MLYIDVLLMSSTCQLDYTTCTAINTYIHVRIHNIANVRVHLHTRSHARTPQRMHVYCFLSLTHKRTYGTYMCIYVHTVALMFPLKI